MNFSILSRTGALALLTHGLLHAELEVHPNHFGASVDLGQVVESQDKLPDNQPITRTSAYMAMSGTWDKRFDINLGMGGVFWYALPEKNFRDRLLLSGFGVGQAEGVYAFGEPESPSARLHMGVFNHKYNPDARNLGEYLFRSGAYPGYIWSGGWSYFNSASYSAQGFLLEIPTLGGKVSHDFALFMERNISPTHDLTPAYLVSVKPTAGITFGAGVSWQNGLSLRGDSVLAPRQRLNAYYKTGPYANVPLSQTDREKPGYEPGDTAIVAAGDPRVGTAIAGRYHLGKPANYTDSAGNGTPNSQLGYYSFKAVKLMARASFDIGVLLAGMKADEFKVYGEWAYMGLQNQPFYYDKPSERMPVLFGLNLPTFGLLEVFNVEVDYRNSVFENTLAFPWDQKLPIPTTSQTDNPLTYRETGRKLYTDEAVAQGQTLATADSAFTADLAKRTQAGKDNAWHWSIYAKRKIFESVSLTAQVASDHLRHFDIVFATPQYTPATQRTKDWYYVMRVEFGI